ncbi:FAD:protein FMN transferase [Robiginitalea sp. M366]|uniref:FAD:protein FMN transferase n=1 Tax=Robiginitalea aestuariiviva TaxID=3036903 RepID=UPI00240DD041|nr:FAD:protein FMN transferase [Robiginitalea aestuariiviva]MDG1571251.1 FAD:protein FMN transferase [Robiginitalea aestuariiviva]
MKKLLLLALLASVTALGQQPYKRVILLMGSRFEITVVASDSLQAAAWTDQAIAEITRIEKLISSWDPNSQTSEINRQAGISPVRVNEELFALIQRSLGISRLTDGAFDISYASMDRIWKFDGSMKAMPPADAVAASVARVGYQKIQLDPKTYSVFLQEPGMKIGFGGIGKGYAADRAKALLMAAGAPAGIINASGDLTTWGIPPGGKPWQVAITNPMDKTHAYGVVPVENRAVVTSGDYEKYVTLDGKRYTHIIDPRTGYPSRGILSVTIFAPKAELADALATSVFVMGLEAGLDRIEQLPGIDGIIVDEHGRLYTTRDIQIQRNR